MKIPCFHAVLNKKALSGIFLVFLCGTIFFGFSVAQAQIDLVWDRYKSETKMYIVEFPGKPKIDRAALRIDPSTVIYSEQMSYEEKVSTPGAPDTTRQYIIRLDQTFGGPFVSAGRKGDASVFLDAEIRKLTEFYTMQGATIVSSDVTGRDDFEGRTMVVDLKNDDGGVAMSARIVLLVRGRTKVQQIVIAPKSVIDRAPVLQFFHSLMLYRGEPVDNGDLKKDWVFYDLDGKSLFNVRLPPGAPPFVPETPKIQVNRNIRSVETSVLDPVRNERLLYRATVYDQGGAKITEDIFDLFLKKYHVDDWDKILVERVAADENFLHGKKLWTPVKPTPEDPRIEEKIIRAYYTNNYFGTSKILVIELTGSKAMLETELAQNLLYSLTLRGDTPLLDGRAAPRRIIKPTSPIDLK